MSQKLSLTPPTVSPAAVLESAGEHGRKILEAGRLLAEFGSFGLIWLNKDLTVEDTFGPLVEFVVRGDPVTNSVLPLIGLEGEICSLANNPSHVLELPTISVTSDPRQAGKLNFTFFWNAERDCPMGLVYKSASQTDIEVELSKQIRARLMAEAEVTAKSKELARANADLESFAAIISHDLKAPLRHMRQLTETAVAKTGAADTTALLDILRDIEGQSQRMSGMLTSLLDYSTLGRKYEAIERIDTRALAEAVRDSLPEVDHTISIEGEWPIISSLRAPLDLILRNLVGNALQHHDRPDGEIKSACEDQPLIMVISVSDDGPGIASQHHDSIFLPFRTVTAAADSRSTGMGLAAVKKAAEGAGGRIEVVSNPQAARGTRFNVYWPKTVRD